MGERVSIWEDSPTEPTAGSPETQQLGFALLGPLGKCWEGADPQSALRDEDASGKTLLLKVQSRADLGRVFFPWLGTQLSWTSPRHLAAISHNDSSSIHSQGEDGPPGNGTEGFPGFPVSAIGLPTYLPRPTWYPSGHPGTWLDEIDQSHQLVQAFGSGPIHLWFSLGCRQPLPHWTLV